MKTIGFQGTIATLLYRPTGVDVALLEQIAWCHAAGSVAEDFKLHRQMAKIFTACGEMAEKGQGIDWGAAKAMVYGSLLLEWNHVRITGQDVQWGTFLHRHTAVKDQNGTRVHSFESYKYCQAHGSIRPQGTNGHWKYASRFHCPQLHLVKGYQILGADFNEANILRGKRRCEAVDYFEGIMPCLVDLLTKKGLKNRRCGRVQSRQEDAKAQASITS